MSLPPLLLASASPRRRELLRELGLEFAVVPANVAESDAEQLSPGELCQLNAYRKARCVAKQHPDALVIGVDTIVCLGATVFGKPADLAEARRTLKRLQGMTHEVVSGVCLIGLRSHRERLFAVSTEVRFRPLTEEEIDRYLAAINPLDKAGAYAIQEKGEWIVESISGSFSNVVGLPLERLREELESWDSSPARPR